MISWTARRRASSKYAGQNALVQPFRGGERGDADEHSQSFRLLAALHGLLVEPLVPAVLVVLPRIGEVQGDRNPPQTRIVQFPGPVGKPGSVGVDQAGCPIGIDGTYQAGKVAAQQGFPAGQHAREDPEFQAAGDDLAPRVQRQLVAVLARGKTVRTLAVAAVGDRQRHHTGELHAGPNAVVETRRHQGVARLYSAGNGGLRHRQPVFPADDPRVPDQLPDGFLLDSAKVRLVPFVRLIQ